MIIKLLIISAISGNVFGQQTIKELHTNTDYLNIIKYYRYLNPDSALFFVQKGLEKAQQEKDELGKAALLNQHGMIVDNLTKFNESRDKYLQAEAIYRQQHDEKGLASTLIRLGVVEKRKGNYDKSLAYAMEALKLSEKNKDKLGILEARVVFSETYYSLGDYNKALKNLEFAHQIDQQIPLSNFSFNMYISFGYVYIKLQKYQKAIDCLETGLAKCHKIEYNGLKVSLLKALGTANLKNGDKEKAVSYFKQALSSARKIKNVLREQSSLVDLSEVYINDNPALAITYLKEALQIVEKSKLYRQQIEILNRMSDLYKKMGDISTALALREKSYVLADEYYYKDMTRQIASLENAYELEKSNAQLSDLKLKNSSQRMVKNVFLSIAIGTFLVLLVTLAYYFRSKHLNKLLKDANLQLEESHNVKDKFFSVVAHDIRSPLASTIGFLKLMNNDDLDEEVRAEIVQKLILHCDNSLTILDKLLKWGQTQIKGIRLNITEFNPLDNINSNVALFNELAEKKNIKLHINVPDQLKLTADSDHFDFIIRNLCSNAIKFTKINGNVYLNAEPIANQMVRFAVIDDGVGIPAHRIKSVFELFAVSTKGTSQEEGTSLGLVICKEFVLANKGALQVESEVDKGTVFTFTLPGKMG